VLSLIIFIESETPLAGVFEAAGISADNRMGDSHGQMACRNPSRIAEIGDGLWTRTTWVTD
jgi:hypothetical protein